MRVTRVGPTSSSRWRLRAVNSEAARSVNGAGAGQLGIIGQHFGRHVLALGKGVGNKCAPRVLKAGLVRPLYVGQVAPFRAAFGDETQAHAEAQCTDGQPVHSVTRPALTAPRRLHRNEW